MKLFPFNIRVFVLHFLRAIEFPNGFICFPNIWLYFRYFGDFRLIKAIFLVRIFSFRGLALQYLYSCVVLVLGYSISLRF